MRKANRPNGTHKSPAFFANIPMLRQSAAHIPPFNIRCSCHRVCSKRNRYNEDGEYLPPYTLLFCTAYPLIVYKAIALSPKQDEK